MNFWQVAARVIRRESAPAFVDGGYKLIHYVVHDGQHHNGK